jgi:hypothetical protein
MSDGRDLGITRLGCGRHDTKHKQTNKKKKTPWPLIRKQTISTERPPLVDEI